MSGYPGHPGGKSSTIGLDWHKLQIQLGKFASSSPVGGFMVGSVLIPVLAGFPADLAAYPSFTLRTHQQANIGGKVPGIVSLVTKMQASKIGLRRSLYAGFVVSMATSPFASVLYGGGIQCGRIIGRALGLEDSHPLSSAIQGGGAQFGGSVVWVPGKRVMELAATSNNPSADPKVREFQKLSIPRKVLNIWNEGGIRSLFKGGGGQFAVFTVTNALAMWAYNNLLRIINQSEHGDSFLLRFMAAGGSFALASSLTTPLDAAVTVTQIQEGSDVKIRANTVSKVLSEMYARFGVVGMFMNTGGASRAAWLGTRGAFFIAGMDYGFKKLGDAKRLAN